MIHVRGLLGPRYTTPRRSYEVFKKILCSVRGGGRPLRGGSAAAGGTCPAWGFSLSLFTTSLGSSVTGT